MPRASRVIVPNLPHHIHQRGHDRKPVFIEPDDYRIYLGNLREWSRRLEVNVYAYCLMTNHVHLVLAPGDNPDRLGKLMKRVSARQTRRLNRLEGRTGTLWEGRYRSSPIESEKYLVTCCRYVELNPVRAGMVEDPGAYPWSSYRERVSSVGGWLDEDPLYVALGANREERARAWREIVGGSAPDGEWKRIRDSIQRGQPTGSERFAKELSERLGRRIMLRGPGRPRKSVGK